MACVIIGCHINHLGTSMAISCHGICFLFCSWPAIAAKPDFRHGITRVVNVNVTARRMKPAPARSVAARQVPGDAAHAARRVIHALVRQQRFGVDGPRWQFRCHRSFIIHDFALAIRANEHGLPVFGEIHDAWDAEFVRAWLDGECERGVSVLGAYATTELPEIVRATPGPAHRSQDI